MKNQKLCEEIGEQTASRVIEMLTEHISSNICFSIKRGPYTDTQITEVVRQLAEMQYNKLHFVLGMVNDKDIDSILQLLPRGAEYYFCKADIPRGLDTNILAQKAFDLGLRGMVYESVSHAYRSAVNNARFGDIVFIGGSNFTVAEVV